MKKSFLKLNILIVLATLITVVCVAYFGGCVSQGKMGDNTYAHYTNLAEGQNIKLTGLEGQASHQIIDLGEVKSFNTITLKESGKSVMQFNIYASNEAEESSFKLIYEGDTIEDFRVCYISDVSYRYLKVEVARSTGTFKVNDIKVYNNTDSKATQRVCSYFILDRVVPETAPEGASEEEIEAHKERYDHQFDALATVTDLIIFGMTDFDIEGNVIISNPELFDNNIALLKNAVQKVQDEQGRHINMLVDIFMPERHKDDPNAGARTMMSSESATLNAAKSINALLDKYSLDGVDFDYEYPYSHTEKKLYNNFLVSIKANLTKNKLLSTAVGAWNLDYSKEALEAVDLLQLMTYDMFDSHGYHAAFNSCVMRDVNTLLNKGVAKEKIVLGLPFYSRPLNKSGYWGDYATFYNGGYIQNKFTNVVYSFHTTEMSGVEINDAQYLNGVQMIADKTAFSIDAHLAGVMIWHYHCDIEYDNDMSLFRAINSTINAKGATLAK